MDATTTREALATALYWGLSKALAPKQFEAVLRCLDDAAGSLALRDRQRGADLEKLRRRVLELTGPPPA